MLAIDFLSLIKKLSVELKNKQRIDKCEINSFLLFAGKR